MFLKGIAAVGVEGPQEDQQKTRREAEEVSVSKLWNEPNQSEVD